MVRLGRLEEALESTDAQIQALKQDQRGGGGRMADACCNRGLVLAALGHGEAAAASFQAGLEAAEGHLGCGFNAVVHLIASGRAGDADVCWMKVRGIPRDRSVAEYKSQVAEVVARLREEGGAGEGGGQGPAGGVSGRMCHLLDVVVLEHWVKELEEMAAYHEMESD